jgi:glycosyltransferase involved in cell wall biosynthesis
VRIAVVTYHLPHPDGTATGRHVYAIWEAARALGHDVSAWCWGHAPAGLEAPEWVRCERYHDPGGWRRRPATLLNPRGGIASLGWRPPADAVAWAEEPESFPAVAPADIRGVTLYHSTRLDAAALRQFRLADLQSVRAERRAVRRADLAIAFSPRVAAATRVRELCPVTQPIPHDVLPIIAEPIAVMIADWAWAPNQVALRTLLAAWPAVRQELPDARLLIAGRGAVGVPPTDGVEVVGEVAHTRDVLRRAAVLAFPCPPTSGPKMKVLDALAGGLPVVTTAAGVEGLTLSTGSAAVATLGGFATELAAVLGDPERRAQMAATGREDVLRHHRPSLAAAARLALIDRIR